MTVAGANAEMVGDSTQERYVSAGGQRIRVSIRPGSGVPLVLCNGIGAGSGGTRSPGGTAGPGHHRGSVRRSGNW